MDKEFSAYLLSETPNGVRGALTRLSLDDLDAADTLIRVEWSSINYKDALAGTGKGAIARRLPLIGGVDFAGRVVESDQIAVGTEVLACGGGLSETLHGGFSQYVRMPAEQLVELPAGLSARDAMGIGTAGLTAAMAVMRLEHEGLKPESGPVAVTGATGGVGSFAIDILAKRGYEVVAVTGAGGAATTWLKAIGAAGVLDRHKLEDDARPLHRASWAGVIDNAGGSLLALLLKAVIPRGSVAAIGLAGGTELATTVMPFILRGVTLAGINSVDLTADERNMLWALLADELRPPHLAAIASREASLEELPGALEDLLLDSVPGRTVVRIG